MKTLTTILFVSVLACISMRAEDIHFINTGNPLIKHIHTADPAPMVDGDTLWLYAGHDEGDRT